MYDGCREHNVTIVMAGRGFTEQFRGRSPNDGSQLCEEMYVLKDFLPQSGDKTKKGKLHFVFIVLCATVT